MIMELDDLKKDWKELQTVSSNEDTPEILAIISRSRKSVRKIFAIEILIAVAIYIGFIIMVVIYGVAVPSYLYKVVMITLLLAIPIYYRLYRSIHFLENLNFGKDMKSMLTQFLIYYKNTMKIYKWGSYLMIIFIVIAFFTDKAFMELSTLFKTIFTAYLGLLSLTISPLVNRIYGRRIKGLEQLLVD